MKHSAVGYFLFSLFIAVVSLIGRTWVQAASPEIRVLRIEGSIVPAVVDYVNRGLDQAESQGASMLVLEINTPGGLYDSTQRIVQRILNAKIPVIAFVSPAGGWAGSAGTFITLSANIGAMAPGSRIGAAHPVSPGADLSEEMKQKISEDASAFIRSIARMRGKDPFFAEQAVRESKSYSDEEAFKNNLIDIRATDLEDLLKQVNGRKVTLATGEQVVLNTTGYELNSQPMSTVDKFLQIVSDPNVAYILLTIATIGIMAELYNPGLIFPGVVGGISLLLAFYSLGVLNAYWGGVLLIFLAYAFFIAEAFITSHGILMVGGILSFIVGSLILFSGSSSGVEVNRGLIAGLLVVIVASLGLLMYAVIRAQTRRPATGPEGLIGQNATVKTKLDPNGMVLIEGERWAAVLETGKAHPGEEVIVTKIDGLTLTVTKKQK